MPETIETENQLPTTTEPNYAALRQDLEKIDGEFVELLHSVLATNFGFTEEDNTEWIPDLLADPVIVTIVEGRRRIREMLCEFDERAKLSALGKAA